MSPVFLDVDNKCISNPGHSVACEGANACFVVADRCDPPVARVCRVNVAIGGFQRWHVAGAAAVSSPSEIDAAVLEALPPDIREEAPASSSKSDEGCSPRFLSFLKACMKWLCVHPVNRVVWLMPAHGACVSSSGFAVKNDFLMVVR